MIVRRHVVCKSADVVGQAVVCHVYHSVDIGSADGLMNSALGLAASETGAGAV